jgi:hypothetical protein
MMALLRDPRAFNWFVVVLYAVVSVRWAWARNWPQVVYWIGAVIINAGVAMMAPGGKP